MEWVAISSPGDLPDPRIEPGSPALQADSTIWATRNSCPNASGTALHSWDFVLPQSMDYLPLNKDIKLGTKLYYFLSLVTTHRHFLYIQAIKSFLQFLTVEHLGLSATTTGHRESCAQRWARKHGFHFNMCFTSQSGTNHEQLSSEWVSIGQIQ